MPAKTRAALPPYDPQLATLVKEAPAGDDWLHELKYDGYRIGLRLDDGKVTLLSRRSKDWTAQFPELVGAARKLKRSEEHTSELQSLAYIVCSLLHAKKNNYIT